MFGVFRVRREVNRRMGTSATLIPNTGPPSPSLRDIVRKRTLSMARRNRCYSLQSVVHQLVISFAVIYQTNSRQKSRQIDHGVRNYAKSLPAFLYILVARLSRIRFQNSMDCRSSLLYLTHSLLLL